MSRTINIIDIIKSSGVDPVEAQSLITYREAYTYEDLNDENLITKRMLDDKVANINEEIPVPIDADPKTYTYVGLRDFPQIRFSYVGEDGKKHPGQYDWSYDEDTKEITFDIPTTDAAIAYIS